MTHTDAEDRHMQAKSTFGHHQPARLIGIIASGLVAAVLVVAFVVANLGLGAERERGGGRLQPPPATIAR